MKINLFSALLLTVAITEASAAGAVGAAPASAPAAPAALTVRAVSWDYSWKPEKAVDWRARVIQEIASGVNEGADVIIFPENFSMDKSIDVYLEAFKDAAQGRLVVLGNTPHREPDGSVVSRAYILANGAWQSMDKLDPTPAERARKPPIKGGFRIILFRYLGGVVAALPAYTIEKPEFAVAMKKRAVQLLLVSAPPQDEEGSARLARCASARAVELGAAVVVVPPSTAAPALYLPAQKGFDLKPQAPSGRDFIIPWKRLTDLRVPAGIEPRPFLDVAPAYQTEI